MITAKRLRLSDEIPGVPPKWYVSAVYTQRTGGMYVYRGVCVPIDRRIVVSTISLLLPVRLRQWGR